MKQAPLLRVGQTFLLALSLSNGSAIFALGVALAAERPQPPRRWVLTETRTLKGVGRAQGAAVHDGKLYVYGDADTGVIVEFTLDLQPTGRRLRLTRGGGDLISHPTGLTFHPRYGVFIGDSARGLLGRSATIYQIDWERAWADGTLDHAVRAVIQDDLAKAGTRPEFVRVGDRWLLATADYAPDGQVRLYDPGKLRDGGRTSELGVLVGWVGLNGRSQSLSWENRSGWLYCIQNPDAGRGWRVVIIDLERTFKESFNGPGLDLIQVIDFPFDNELEGLALLPEDHFVLVTSEKQKNIHVGHFQAAAK